MSRILVIGGSGHVGSQVVSQLVEAGVSTRAMARKPEAAQLASQVEVVRGDLTMPESLDAPLRDVETVFLVWTAPPAAAESALERIATHARRIVYLTAPHQTPHPFFQQPNAVAVMHARNEELIERSSLQWTFLRPGMFAGNCRFWWGPQLREGDAVRWPYLDAPTAPIDERDIAAVAVRALCDASHAGGDYVLTGPQSLTQREQIEIVGRALGRTLHIEELSPDEARVELGRMMPVPVIDMLLRAWGAALGQPAYVTSTVAEVLGRPARSFEAWAADHVSEF